MSWAIVFLLMSRLPIYGFVIYKAWKYRNSLILISSRWLGLMALAAAVGALSNAFVDAKLIVNIFGAVFSLSMLMVGITAKEVKKVK